MKETKPSIKSSCERKVSGSRKQTKEDVEANFENEGSSSKLFEKVQRFIQKPCKDTKKKQNAKNTQLHQEKMERFPPLPYRKEEISPEAAKLPLPSEKERILSFSPSMLSFMPLTVSRMHLSEKASTLSTPVNVSLFLFSNVRRLFVSSCIRHCMRSLEVI